MIPRLIVLGAVLAGAGCASANTSTLANRFVRQGTPAVDLGGPRLAVRHAPSKLKHAPPPPEVPPARTAANASATAGSVSSFETVNPDLRDALMRVMFAPTVEHHLRVARAYRRAGILDRAYDYLTRSLTVNGPDPAVYDERARLWRDWGNPEFALPDSYRAIYLAPQSAALHNTLGTVLYRLGQRQEAEESFEQALALDANAWYALANLCHVNLARGRTRDAITLCRQATAARDKERKR